MTKLRIAIGYPSPDLISTYFSQNLLNLVFKNWLDYDIQVLNAHSSRIVMNRNRLVADAQKMKADYLLWIDADTLFPTDALKRLLAHDKDVACAAASRRVGNDRSPAAYPLDIKSIQPFQKLVPMEFIGLPFMLTKMNVFDKMEKPYFAEPPRRMMNVHRGKDSLLNKVSEEELANDVMPEDEYFCWKLRQAGFDIWCDMQLSMEIGHVGSKVYYIENPVSDAPESNIGFDVKLNEESVHRKQDGIGE